MMPYTKEQFWKLYDKLPRELKDALGAEETSDDIHQVCESYGLSSSQGDITDLATQVLVGTLLPQDFQKELLGLGIKKTLAEKVAREINRFIFYPVKPALEQLHKMEIEVSAKVVTPEPLVEPEGSSGPERPAKEAETPAGGPDSYREPIE